MRKTGWVVLIASSSMAGVLGGLAAGWALLMPPRLQMPIRNQDMHIIIRDTMGIQATVVNAVDVTVDDVIHTRVPVDQVMDLRLDDTLQAMARFDSPVRVRMNVPIKDKIRLDQMIPINTTVETEFLGAKQRLPIRGMIPIKAAVPINLVVPIDQDVPVRFNAPVSIRIDQALSVPLKTEFEADIPIRGQLRMPYISRLDTRVLVDPVPLLIEVESADIDIPASAIRLVRPGA